MAAPNRCFTCEKAPGAYFCAGCKASFCIKDVLNHHRQLLNELHVLAERCNDLQEKMNEATSQNHSDSGLFLQIDEWQNTTVEKVKEAADGARQQLTRILKDKYKKITTEFETFSNTLVHIMKKDEECVVHDDLTELQQMIQKLDQDLKQLAHPPAVELHTEQNNQVDWNRLIYVEQKSKQRHSVRGCFY